VVTVDVIDEGTPPERKTRPKRGIMMAAAFLTSLVFGAGYATLPREAKPRPLMRAVVDE